MTTDNQKKYEEAANAFVHEKRRTGWDSSSKGIKEHFLAGASFAEKEGEKFILQLKEHIEGQQNSAEILARGLHSRDKEIEQLQEENQRLKEALKEAADYINSHPAERIITVGERIVKNARKLIEP